ncbi:hypothetical protein AKJ09_05539 [Labilithrix luteola]|uniref:DUF423 domain-containing protein n=1 Tax=Labilithrix luteola TaxID=1391654 RepID=A0A0K1PZB1_9BACT|nr:DUF423 domain-containing protein [Labilithrix luteola]AKU98875.1 hypothetical protein AKJ09_05539 [Labilithrix luteola]
MERFALLASGTVGFLAVALGAFGAHGLKARLAPLADGVQRLEWWNTGAHYQAIHALALGLVAYLASRSSSTAVTVAAIAFLAGVLLFSGSLYLMTLTGLRWLGAVTPLGGLAFLVGWASIFVAAWSLTNARP